MREKKRESARVVIPASVHVWVRRHRRSLGATLAALSVVFIISSLRTTPEPTATIDTGWALPQGYVAVPLALESTLTQSLTPGDLVDIHRIDGVGAVRVADEAEVLRINGSSIVVTVNASDARALVGASLADLGVVITGRAER